MDTASLKSDIDADPDVFGKMVESGNDAGIASAYNDPARAGSGSVLAESMSKDDFLLAVLGAVSQIATLDTIGQARWDRIVTVACAANSVAINSPAIQGILDMAVSDRLMTKDYRATIGRRPGSRAEVLWGAGTVVSVSDVSFALRGTR